MNRDMDRNTSHSKYFHASTSHVTFTLLHLISPLLAPNNPNQNKLPNTATLAPTSKPRLKKTTPHYIQSRVQSSNHKMCAQQTLSCPLCHHTSTRPPPLCPDAEVWGRACKSPHMENVVDATCSDECREKQREVRAWGHRKAERRESERRGRYEGGGGGMEVAGWKEV
jgi:hypothetical protein